MGKSERSLGSWSSMNVFQVGTFRPMENEPWTARRNVSNSPYTYHSKTAQLLTPGPLVSLLASQNFARIVVSGLWKIPNAALACMSAVVCRGFANNCLLTVVYKVRSGSPTRTHTHGFIRCRCWSVSNMSQSLFTLRVRFLLLLLLLHHQHQHQPRGFVGGSPSASRTQTGLHGAEG